MRGWKSWRAWHEIMELELLLCEYSVRSEIAMNEIGIGTPFLKENLSKMDRAIHDL